MSETTSTERVLINSLIHSTNGQIKAVRSAGGQDLFNSFVNKKIYESIEEMYLQGLLIDTIQLSTYIALNKKLIGVTQEDPFNIIGAFSYDIGVAVNVQPLVEMLLIHAERKNVVRKLDEFRSEINRYPSISLIDLSKRLIECQPNIKTTSKSKIDVSIRDLLDSQPPEIKWIIPSLLPACIVGLVYGEGGSQKSFAILRLCLQMAICEHYDQNWLCKFPLVPKKSLYVSLEDCRTEMHRRIHTIQKAITCPVDFTSPDPQAINNLIDNNFSLLCREQLFGDKKEHSLIDENANPTEKFYELAEIAIDRKSDVIFIDTRNMASKVGENDIDKASSEMNTWNTLRDITSATIILVSHTSKVSRNGIENNGQNALRGASSRIDHSRFGMWFKPKETDAEGKRLIDVENTKNSYCKIAKKFTVASEYPNFSLVDQVEKKVETISDISNAIVELVKTTPGLSQNKIVTQLKRNRNLVGEVISLLTANKVLVQEKLSGKGGGFGYYLTKDSPETKENQLAI